MAMAGATVRQDGVVRSAFDWLKFTEIDWPSALAVWPALADIEADVAESVATDARYSTYLRRQDADVARFRNDEALLIDENLDFTTVPGLTTEMRDRLSAGRPSTIGAASRVRGITPAALTALLVYGRRAA
jgi:tRNA uridine 5-carboxymethylaminomethyl modification enzyme